LSLSSQKVAGTVVVGQQIKPAKIASALDGILHKFKSGLEQRSGLLIKVLWPKSKIALCFLPNTVWPKRARTDGQQTGRSLRSPLSCWLRAGLFWITFPYS
jgi:hypothetical protein